MMVVRSEQKDLTLKVAAAFIAFFSIEQVVHALEEADTFAARVSVPPPVVDDLMRKISLRVPGVRTASPEQQGGAQILLDYLSISMPDKQKNAVAASTKYGTEELAWGLAYDLQAAIEAFSQTGDTRFLDLFEAGFDVALLLRDDVMGRRDAVRGVVMPAWGSFAYSSKPNIWISWDALTGMVAYPAIRYSAMVLSLDRLRDRHDRAARYLGLSLEAVEAFDPWWRDEGYYYDPHYKTIAPLNHMNLLGSAHVVLCASFSIKTSCEKATGLASFFRRHLRRSDGACIWSYWEGVDPEDAPGEDVTHAFLNVEFADIAQREGIVFSEEDLRCIATTFATRVVRKNTDWAAAIDGTGNLIRDRMHYGLNDFVRLGRVRPELVSMIQGFVLANENAFPLGQLSYAAGPKAFALLLGREPGRKLPKVPTSTRGVTAAP